MERAVQLEPDNAQAVILLARLKFGYVQDPKGWVEAEQSPCGVPPSTRSIRSRTSRSRRSTCPAAEAGKPPEGRRVCGPGGALDLNDPRPALPPRARFFPEERPRTGDEGAGALPAAEADAGGRSHASDGLTSGRAIRSGPTTTPASISDIPSCFPARRAAGGARAGAGRGAALPRGGEAHPGAGQPDTALGWLRVGASRRAVDPIRDRLAARAEGLRRKGGDGPLLPVP